MLVLTLFFLIGGEGVEDERRGGRGGGSSPYILANCKKKKVSFGVTEVCWSSFFLSAV